MRRNDCEHRIVVMNVIRQLVLMLLVFPACAMAQQPIVIKFSHIVANAPPKGLAAEYFKKKAEEYTQGRVRVEVYANSTLYNDKEEVGALLKGDVQMLAPSFAKFSGLGVRAFELFELPYIFENYEQVHKITEGPIGRSILARLEPKGIHGLAYWDNGFKSFSANEPIRLPTDLRGRKMRIQSSRVLEAQMHALGAVPVVMPFSEVYYALKTGALDGTENPISNLYSQRMYEVQSHLTMTEHGYLGYAVIVNKTFWDGLPVWIRKQLALAMAESTKFANRIAKYRNNQDLEKLRKSGRTKIYYPSATEREAFRQALQPVHKEMAPRIGQGLLQGVYMALHPAESLRQPADSRRVAEDPLGALRHDPM